MIRTFVAILLSEALRESVAGTIEQLRPLCPAVAWVPAGNLHLTLQFLGDQPEERLTAAEAALAEAAARSAPMNITLRGIGAFPGLERPRMLWIGLAPGALEARALQAWVADALASRGFPRERPWHPHLTIGRVHDEPRWRLEAGPPLRRVLAHVATTTFGTLRVSEMVLMRSELSSAGARYAIRCGAPLAADPGPDGRDPGAGTRVAL